ncbi:MAG: hypothetical protein KAS75_05575 [Planctomycetes bacterium]|nr:hypothetical protein [Planctomycetota bacterium]
MSSNVEYYGLCSTCKNTPDCTFKTDLNKPVFYCEQFEVEKPPPVIRKEETPSIDSYAAGDEEAAKVIGLCGDCENRKTCVFPKPEGGIWHCEEYQ